MNEVVQFAGPRRHRVQFTCAMNDAGTLVDLLVQKVEAPTFGPALEEGRFQLKFVCVLDDLGSILAVVSDKVADVYVQPASVEEVRRDTTRAMPVTALQASSMRVTRVPPKKKYDTNGSATNKAINAMMALYANCDLVGRGEFIDVLTRGGHSAGRINELVRIMMQRELVERVGHGKYRRKHRQTA